MYYIFRCVVKGADLWDFCYICPEPRVSSWNMVKGQLQPSEKLFWAVAGDPSLWLCIHPVASEVLLTRWSGRLPVLSAGQGDLLLLKGYRHQRQKMSKLESHCSNGNRNMADLWFSRLFLLETGEVTNIKPTLRESFPLLRFIIIITLLDF